ncbi:MAG: hypothetical protein AAF570_21630 [Bacteroidota bacterium]
MMNLKPSEEDLNPQKKPRFKQDMIAFLVMLLGGVAAIIASVV